MIRKKNHYIYPDLDTLAGAVLCDLNNLLKESRQEGREVHIALSGGTTPLAIFSQLRQTGQAEEWKHVHLYWGDERCVSSGSAESNFGNAHRIFIEELELPEENIHPIRGEEIPEKEAKRYAALLKERLPVKNAYPVFDWIWLGLGEDGHTASIFPDQMQLLRSENACEVATHPLSGQKRITITGGVINAARKVSFLVSGKSKSKVINDIVMKEGKYLDYPAFYVAPDSGYLEWYMDIPATSWM